MYAVVSSVSVGWLSGLHTCTTAAIDTTGADLIVIELADYDGGAPALSVITDSKGNTWLPLTTYKAGGAARSTLFYCRPTSVGSGHTFTATGTNTYPAISVGAFSGSIATPFDLQNGANASLSTTISPGSITPSQADELVVVGSAADSGAHNTIGGGFTILTQAVTTPSERVSLSYLIQTTAAAANPLITGAAASHRAASIACFKVGLVKAHRMFQVF